MDSTKREPETLPQNNAPQLSESPIMNPLPTPRSNDHPATTVESQSEGMDESSNEGGIERIAESRSDSQNQSPIEMSVSANSDYSDQEVHSGGAEASHAAFITITPTAEVELSIEMSDDCAICKESLQELSMVMPCGHLFDLGCIRNWLDQLLEVGEAATQCPMCRAGIDEIWYNFSEDDSFEAQALGPTPEAEEPLDVIGYLRSLPDLEKTWREYYLSLRGRDASFVTNIFRRVDLSIVQMGVVTATLFIQYLLITYESEDCPSARVDGERDVAPKAAMQAYEILKREANQAAEEVKDWTSTDDGESIQGSIHWLDTALRDERGLLSTFHTSMTIKKSRVYPGKILIARQTVLIEDGPANLDGILQPKEIEAPLGLNQVESLQVWEYAREAREQIQGTLDWCRRQEESNEDFRLERLTTNLLEPYEGGTLCSYCREEHRNGDCLLPWDRSEPWTTGEEL